MRSPNPFGTIGAMPAVIMALAWLRMVSAQDTPVSSTSGAAAGTATPLPSGTAPDPMDAKFEWAVIGDSWASGVAYNASNVYKYFETEFCYRTTEAWGAQMFYDKSWTIWEQDFKFAACGGTLMDDLKRQMKDRAGNPSVVWGMFGGNNALFGAVVRACIYQPLPGGWGKPWDEDTDGTGYCKKNIQKADDYMKDDKQMRTALVDALDDIYSVAQDDEHWAKQWHFDLYVSGYVDFFDATTDDCDKWSFAHDWVSAGKPKVVKGLRQAINDKTDQFNDIQEDVIKNYEIPDPKRLLYRIHHVRPSSLYDTHRFCEKDRTFEDQFYNEDMWLWNLQYYDENSGEQEGVTKTDTDGTKYMSGPDGVQPQSQPVLPLDDNAAAERPDGDTPVDTKQAGFGWTARPFHPKWPGHEALKNFFIQNMKDDNIIGVQPNPSTDNPNGSSPKRSRSSFRA